MLGIAFLILGGFAISYGIYDSATGDEEASQSDDNTEIRGTSGPDLLIGGAGNDLILGLAGDDQLEGRAGDDRIDGDDGDDILAGESGNDFLLAGAGSDIVDGGPGDDFIRGQQGSDLLLGGDGSDRVNGDTGDDIVLGGDGDDTVTGGVGNDLVFGDDGDDYLTGGTGDDLVIGGNGSDTLEGNEGADILFGGAVGETDTLLETNGATLQDDSIVDFLDGGAGDDVLIVGDGDTAVGGEGLDLFILLDGAGTEPAQLTDFDEEEDALLYIYDAGEPEPVLGLEANDDGTQTLSANGIGVAIVASASLTVAEITLAERPSTIA